MCFSNVKVFGALPLRVRTYLYGVTVTVLQVKNNFVFFYVKADGTLPSKGGGNVMTHDLLS